LLTEETEATPSFAEDRRAGCRLFVWLAGGKMARVIGQRWEIYEYDSVKDFDLKKGEIVVVKGTPDFGDNAIRLLANVKNRKIEELYNDYLEGVGTPFRTAKAQDVIDAKTLADAKDYADEVAKNEWLKPENTTEELQRTVLSNKKNYLCKVIADPVKSGVYQAVAGWEDEPVWALFDDTVDLVNEQELITSINAHDTSEEAHEYIQKLIHDEEAARIQADYLGIQIIEQALASEKSARIQAVNNEAQIRETNDICLQNNIDETNGNVADLRYDFNSWVGRGGFLDAFNFETSTPTQEQLTDYALSQIPTISDPLQIWNSTKVTNLYDGIVWVLTNTQNTVPTVFEWSPQGSMDLSPFTPNMGGYIVGADINDPPEFVRPVVNGKGKINLPGIMSAILEKIYPIGSSYVQLLNDPTPIERGLPGQWEVWNGRADAYRLSPSPPPPTIYSYQAGANYAANAYVFWHLPGAGYELFKAKAAINNAAAQLDPVLWEKYVVGDIVPRRLVQGWLDNDLNIGETVATTYINYAGRYVTEVICLGGTFPSFEGGNRPPFEGGGLQGEEKHVLTTSEMPSHTHPQDSHSHPQSSHSHTVNSHSHALFIGDQSYPQPVTDAGGSFGSAVSGSGRAITNSTGQGSRAYQYSAASSPSTNSATPSVQGATATNQSTGGGLAHNNIPPTYSIRYWRRVA
jgi:microcystin-dependent protein